MPNPAADRKNNFSMSGSWTRGQVGELGWRYSDCFFIPTDTVKEAKKPNGTEMIPARRGDAIANQSAVTARNLRASHI
jgi:hypothetical protein